MNKYVTIYTHIFSCYFIKIFSVSLLLLCLVNSQDWLCDTKRILLCFLSCILMPIIKKYKQKKKGIIPFYSAHIVSDLLLRFSLIPGSEAWLFLCFGVVPYMFILFELSLNFLDLWAYHCHQQRNILAIISFSK